MKQLLLIVILTFATIACAENSYSDAEALKHAGETAEVHGKVADLHTTDAGMALLNFGAKFPAQTFTAVIFAEKAAQFPELAKCKGATVSVHGEIRLHKEHAEMTLTEPGQLKILTPSEVPVVSDSPGARAAAGSPVGIVVGPDGVPRRIVPFSRGISASP